MNCAPNAPERIHIFIVFAVPAFAPQPSATSYSKEKLRSLNTGTQTNLSVVRVADMAALVTEAREPDVSFRFARWSNHDFKRRAVRQYLLKHRKTCASCRNSE